jgi:DNA-binding MarR family transcriptional regulator
MSRDLELLTEIRDLLQLMAEPAIAKRDAKLRAALRDVIGGNENRARVIQLMNGTRSQADIAKESGYDKGSLSKLIKAMDAAKLVSLEDKSPRLLISVPARFFDKDYSDE